jgi:hypothetical protein
VLFRIIVVLIVIVPAIRPLGTPQAQESYQTTPTEAHAGSGNKFPESLIVRHPQAAENPQPKPAEKTQKDSGQKESPIDKAWQHWMRRFFSDIKITDALLALFTGLLALYTARLWIATHQTGEIALAALGRPHLFFEFLHHNFDEWRAGRADYPFFFYQFTNYGTSPAIVQHIIARAVLSRGPGFGADEETHIVEQFPAPDQLSLFLTWNPSVRVAKQTPSGWESGQDWLGSRAFVISPQRSAPFATNAWCISLASRTTLPQHQMVTLQNYLYEQSGEKGWVRPWLIGRIIYCDTLGRRHHTSFCVQAWKDGEYTEDRDPPYNERT